MNKHRQELQHNELADWLEEKTADVRPYLPAIGIGTVVALLLIVGIWWYSTQQAQASAASWNQYFSALGERNQEEALKKVIEEEKANAPANWARQTLGDMLLARGSAAVFTDREESKKRLEEAGALYSEILKNTSDPLLEARAGFGLARVQESLFKPEEALKQYEQVANSQKDTTIGQAAADAVTRLKEPGEVELLNWLAKQTPKRPAPSPTGRPGGIPNMPSDLPDRPDLGFPGLDDPGSSSTEKTTPGLSFPAPGDAPASDAPPAGEAPATDSAPTEGSAPEASVPEAPAAEPTTDNAAPPDEGSK
jgi:predicted negative regulator of RcsB-dependent stress response